MFLFSLFCVSCLYSSLDLFKIKKKKKKWGGVGGGSCFYTKYYESCMCSTVVPVLQYYKGLFCSVLVCCLYSTVSRFHSLVCLACIDRLTECVLFGYSGIGHRNTSSYRTNRSWQV